jgi:hypothetical protein
MIHELLSLQTVARLEYKPNILRRTMSFGHSHPRLYSIDLVPYALVWLAVVPKLRPRSWMKVMEDMYPLDGPRVTSCFESRRMKRRNTGRKNGGVKQVIWLVNQKSGGKLLVPDLNTRADLPDQPPKKLSRRNGRISLRMRNLDCLKRARNCLERRTCD